MGASLSYVFSFPPSPAQPPPRPAPGCHRPSPGQRPGQASSIWPPSTDHVELRPTWRLLPAYITRRTRPRPPLYPAASVRLNRVPPISRCRMKLLHDNRKLQRAIAEQITQRESDLRSLEKRLRGHFPPSSRHHSDRSQTLRPLPKLNSKLLMNALYSWLRLGVRVVW